MRLALSPGAKLRVRAGDDGAWCYLAVGGRIDVPPMLGSNATHTRSALGGIDGRALAAGDVLPVRDAGAASPARRRSRRRGSTAATIRSA